MIERLQKVRLLPIAVHEAGHAVVAAAYRIRFDRVLLHREPKLIEEGGYYSGGEVRGLVYPLAGRTRVKVRTFYRRLDDLIAVLLAGREATQMLFNLSGGHEKDYEDVNEVLAVRSPMATTTEREILIASLRLRAAQLLRKNIVGLFGVARRLEDYAELTYREVRMCVYTPSGAQPSKRSASGAPGRRAHRLDGRATRAYA
jgi:hypothetical protein